jgi:hypothetical protein
MTIDRRLVAGAMGLAILLAACGGTAASPGATGGASSPEPAAPATSEPTAAPTEAATDEATEEPTDQGGIGLPGGLNDLASVLPEAANGVTFERAGFNGDQLGLYGAALGGLDDSDLDPILREHGKTIADVNFAIASATGGEVPTSIYALQIEGVEAADWMGAANLDTSSVSPTTVGGKTVFAQGGGGFNIWVYPTGDTVFVVLLGDEATAEAILSQLP